MSKHTPGPWEVGVYDFTETMKQRLKFKQVAVCQTGSTESPTGLLIALCGDIDPSEKTNTEQSLSDARLIAAAPDLLEIAKAYRNLLKTMAHTDGEVATYQHILDVIAKAEGRDNE